MNRKFCAVLCAAVLMSAGCMDCGKIAKQLKDDPAIVVLTVGTPWGVQKMVRVGGQTNSVSVDPDGTVTIIAHEAPKK